MRVIRKGIEIVGIAGLLLLATGCPEEDLPVIDDMGGAADMMQRADMDSMQDSSRADQGDTSGFTIDEVSPSMGDVSGGTSVLINGKGFAPGATVRFGGVDATSVEVKSPTQLSAVTPAYDTVNTVDVEITNPDGQVAVKTAAFSFQSGGIVETPLFCVLQDQSPLTVAINDADAAALYTLIFADGITPGAGQGAGVTAELGVGMGDDYANFSFLEMTFNVDKDGLTPGDLSNDEYVATPPVDATGSFRYVARIKTDGEWLYCDLDGSDNGVNATQLGQLEVQDAPPTPGISFCQLVTGDPVEALSGQQTPTLLARVFNEGVTQGAGQGAQIEGELGYGAEGTTLDTWTYSALTYQGDADGLAQGDLANDDYGTHLILPMAGTFRYVARFRKQGDADWFYCDLDGHDANDPFEEDQAGTLNVSTPVMPSIGFCQTETLSASVKPGEQTPSITGAVYVQGLTEGVGAGAGLTAELTWGAAGTSPTTWINTQTAPYLEDADGLTPGSLANDRYATTLTPAMEGDFDYAYRFSMNGGTDWTLCDTDGSSADPTSFEDDKLGRLGVASVNLPDQCRIQFPTILHDVVTMTGVTVYGRVIEQGITDVSDDAPEIRAELVVGPLSADPIADAALFDTVPMAYGASMPPSFSEDEYSGTWTPTTEGLYKFAVRMSVDSGANYVLCDLDGGSFESLKMGVVSVHALQPDPVDYCHVFQGQVTQSLADPSFPIFTAEVYEMGVTDNNGGANSAQIEAEVGYGALSTNPALPGAYSWESAPFTQVNPGNGNNYEYQGSPYSNVIPPAAGVTYDVVMRMRKTGQMDQDWVYCDNLSSSSDFLLSNVSTLEVVP